MAHDVLMTIFSRRPSLRWLVPAVAAVVLASGASVAGLISANAGSALPQRTASQLLVDVQNARLDGLSGTIVQNADLGLPELPGIGGSGSSDLTSLVSGSHTLRLWYRDPNHVRLSLLGTLGESDVVRNGTDLWTWSSKDKSATHRTVPASKVDAPGSLASVSPVTPQQAADAALKALSPSTDVSTDGTATVAGRSAYELVLQPKDSSSLVDSVRIAVDGKTHIPTRVQVYAKGQDKPSFEVGFTKFDPATPEASVFGFNPPPGTKVTESGSDSALKSPTDKSRSGPEPGRDSGRASGREPKVVGSGWTSVLVVKVPADTGSKTDTGAGSLAQALKALPAVSGSWGSGHLLQGTLFSALLTDDGRLVVGAVAPDALYAALAG
jgi:outer membrane lipoprotein-sorting protein